MKRSQRSNLLHPVVRWVGGKVELKEINPFTKDYQTYEGFEFGKVTAYIGDYVLVSNADSTEPDTLSGCDIGRIEHLFEATGKFDRHRAHVQWYSKPEQIPKSVDTEHLDNQYEVVEDHRNFDNNVSVETIFKRCTVIISYEDESPEEVCSKVKKYKHPAFACRYKLYQIRKKYHLEPIRKLSIGAPTEDYVKLKNVKRNVNSTKLLSNTDITKKATKNVEKNHTPQSPNITKQEISTPKSKSKTLNSKIKSSVLKNNDLNETSVRLEPVIWKLTIQSDSDSSIDASPNKIQKHTAHSYNHASLDCSRMKSSEFLESKLENSLKSTPRKSTKSRISSRSNCANVLTNDSSDIENSPSNRMSNVRNGVVKQTPEKGQGENINRKRKPRRSTSEESIEPRSRSNSPEIGYSGPPAVFKLHEKNGQSLIIKKPVDIDTKLSKKLNDADISGILDSGSESDSNAILETVRKSGAKVVARSRKDRSEELELLRTPKNKEVTPKSNCASKEPRSSTPKSVRRNLSNTLDVHDTCNNPKDMLLKKMAQKREDASLRIKLRRSTEQSNYKIDSDSDNDVSKRKVVHGTPKSILKTISKGPGTPNVRFKFNDKEVEDDSTPKQSSSESVRRSSRIRTPNSKYSGKTDEISSNLGSGTPKRRSRKSINYNENNPSKNDGVSDSVESNRRSTRSLRVTNHNNSENDVGNEILAERMTPRRGGSKKRDYNYEDDSDESFTGSVISKTIGKRSNSKDKNDTSRCKPECIDSTVETSTLKKNRTPQKSRKSTSTFEISTPSNRNTKIQDDNSLPTTPKRTVGTPKSHTPSRAVKNGLLTPSMRQRIATIAKPETPLQEARSRLHVSAVPKSLPCREEEFNNIYTFLEGKLQDNSGGCMYISGVPGTGKTATVNEVIRCLKKSVSKGRVDNFEFIEINGMKLTEPRQAYVQILKQLTGKSATWEQAHQLLEKKFTRPGPRRIMTLLLVDELDVLCNKRQDVVYNLLDWPAKTSAHLVVITIANTMDLPERVLMGRVTSRLGLTRLTFQPYTHKQLQEIVTARLNDSHAFKSEAVQLVARKVAAVSGDARRALDICRRATEIAELKVAEIVSMEDVTQALTEMIASAKVQAIRHCSEMERTFLQAVCAEIARTGVEEATFNSVYNQLITLCSFEGVQVPTVTEALAICGRLGSSRLLICEHSRKDIHQRILLNVSSDDVHFAMQSIDV